MPKKHKKRQYRPKKKARKPIRFNLKKYFKPNQRPYKKRRNKKSFLRKRDKGLIAVIAALFIGGWLFNDEVIEPLTWIEHDNTPQVFQTARVDQAEFITTIGGYAQKNYENSGVLPSVVIAQAILESNFGSSELASTYNNLYGYKAGEHQLAVEMPTLEYVDNTWIEVSEPFKVYQSWEESVRDHGQLMTQGTVWDTDLYQDVVRASTYTEATKSLQDAGYATDPNYSSKLNQIIEKYDLDAYDKW